jgi:hypothetical protein
VSLDAFSEQAPLDPAKLRALLPEFGTAGLEQAEAAPRPRGKILKLKLGFNPNSSSVGTTVVVLLWSLASSGAVLALAASVLAWRLSGRAEEKA